ncbi:hypothetical protein KEM56_000134 [Ascosphaera pollenicola]|nr:hypothetical protein KEM56_000134 [Ascosphaera pollenicola]
MTNSGAELPYQQKGGDQSKETDNINTGPHDPISHHFEDVSSESSKERDVDASRGFIVGGSHAGREDNVSTGDYPVRHVDFDFPLTKYKKVQDEGHEYIVLDFVEGDRENPFNWPSAKKTYTSLLLLAQTLFIGLGTTAYSSGINRMVKDLGRSTELGQLGLFCFNFACAIAPLFLAPFCELVGRRLVYSGAFILFMCTFIGLSLGRNIATILCLRVLEGFFGCVGTILVGGTFSDMYESKDRAIPMASFAFIAIFGTVAAPIYSGFVDQAIGWRWLQGIQGMSNIPLAVLVTFTFQETRGGVYLKKRAKVLRAALGDERIKSPMELESHDVKQMLHTSCVKAIKMLITEPVVLVFGLWIAFAWAITFLFLSVIPITFEENHGWSEGVGGLPYISLCLGTTIGFVFNFLQIRKYKAVCAAAGHGVPEARLYGAMFGGCMLPIGLFIYSFTQYSHVHWIGPAIALAPIAIGIFFIVESCYSYTADCYGENSSSAIAGQGFFRNTLGAVTPLFASQFFHNVGSQYAGLILALIATILTFIPFILFKYGPTLRARSKLARAGQAAAEEKEKSDF